MGDEEQRILVPGRHKALEELQGLALPADVVGPLPAEAFFAHHERYDAGDVLLPRPSPDTHSKC